MNRAHLFRPAICAALCALMFAGPAAGQSPLGRVAVGQPFPELRLARLADGQPASLADFRGRRVLLLVFASW